MSIINRIRLPRTTLTVEGSALSPAYRCIVEITGVSVQRTTTSEETLAGIESLDPPTVVGSTVQQTKDLAVRAAQSAIASSEGSISILQWGAVALAVGQSVAEAFVAEGIDA